MSDVLSPLSRRASQRRDEPHFVYQFWRHDVCIYVGATSNLGQRISTHAKARDWWPSVTRVSADIYPDKYTALTAEKDLIEQLDPWANKQGVL